MKCKVFILAAFLLAFGNFAVAGNNVPEQFVNPTPPNSSNLSGVWFTDDIDLTRIPTSLYASDPVTGQAIKFCTGLKDPNCSTASQFMYNSLLPACTEASEVDCIESLFALKSNSNNRILGAPIKMLPATVGRGFEGDPSNGLPQGANSSIWRLPGVSNSAGNDEYALVVTRQGALTKSPDGSFQSKFGSFRAGIFPISEVADSSYKANVPIIDGSNRYGITHPSQKDFRSCAIVADGECALRQSFPVDTQFGITVRLSKKMAGWLHGRIDQPQFNYQLTDYGTKLEVQGFPTVVPTLSGWIDPSTLTAAQKAAFDQYSLSNNSGRESDPSPSGLPSINAFNTWLDLLNNKATAMPGEWVFHTLDNADLRTSNACIAQSTKLAGFVTTNASTYLAGAPTYNQTDGTLDYKVAAPHFAEDGSVFQGSYDLYIGSDVARCIYKFSDAPIKATISIVDVSGSNQVATTSVSEKDGYLHLAAKGFTFSTPTLKVGLSQEAPKPSPTLSPAPAPSASQLVTPSPSISPSPLATSTPSNLASPKSNPTSKGIICIKGKVKKIVTASKCPSGYRPSK